MIGYSAVLDCQPLTEILFAASFVIDVPIGGRPSNDVDFAGINITYAAPDTPILQCHQQLVALNISDQGVASTNADNPLVDRVHSQVGPYAAIEAASGLTAYGSSGIDNVNSAGCSQNLVQGWIGAQQTSGPTPSGSGNALTSTFISCRPQVRSALYETTLTPTGRVLSASQLSTTVNHPLSSLDVNFEAAINFTKNALTLSYSAWHNDTLALDWNNYLIQALTGSSAFLDPTLPPPSHEKAMNLTSEIYSRVFAIQLHLLRNQLVPANNPAPLQALFYTPTRRMFMSEPLF